MISDVCDRGGGYRQIPAAEKNLAGLSPGEAVLAQDSTGQLFKGCG